MSNYYYSKPGNVYTTLDPPRKYNDSLSMGPIELESPILPSAFPIHYDTLTKGHANNGYLDFGSAYGKSCQEVFYVSDCPSNRKTRVFVDGTPHVTPTPTPSVQEHFTTTPMPMSILDQLKSLKIHLFYDPQCHYCKLVLDYLKKHNLLSAFHLVDITDPVQREKLIQLGGYGTPFFYSEKTHKTHQGLFDDVEMLYRKLSSSTVPSTTPSPDPLKSLDVVVYTMPGCGYCEKLVAHLLQVFPKTSFEVMDIYTVKDKSSIQHVNAFPYTVSKKTGKSVTGYFSPDKLLEMLH